MEKQDHWTHKFVYEQTPQVFPAASRIYPFYPQVVPHEFLIFQLPETIPTNKTA